MMAWWFNYDRAGLNSMSGNGWASVVALSTVLALVVRSLAGHRLPRARWLWLAGVWIVIIAVLSAIFSRFPVSTP
jgi:uncharacterized membrane protein YoaK (UPF0700 family)